MMLAMLGHESGKAQQARRHPASKRFGVLRFIA
jgi:hypothetical protein